MPPGDDDDGGNHDPAKPLPAPPAASDKPPTLNYPSPLDEAGDFGETESWSEIGRAMGIVFGVLGLLFFITFGMCGIFARGCG